MGHELGMTDKAGAWMTYSFMLDNKELAKKIKPELNTEDDEAVLKSFKFQGQDNLYNFFASNPEVVLFLEQNKGNAMNVTGLDGKKYNWNPSLLISLNLQKVFATRQRQRRYLTKYLHTMNF